MKRILFLIAFAAAPMAALLNAASIRPFGEQRFAAAQDARKSSSNNDYVKVYISKIENTQVNAP